MEADRESLPQKVEALQKSIQELRTSFELSQEKDDNAPSRQALDQLIQHAEATVTDIEGEFPDKIQQNVTQLKALLCGLKLCHDDVVKDLGDFIRQTNDNFSSFQYYISEIFSELNAGHTRRVTLEENLEAVHETNQALVVQVADIGEQLRQLQNATSQIKEDGQDLNRDNEISFKRLWDMEKELQGMRERMFRLEAATCNTLQRIESFVLSGKLPADGPLKLRETQQGTIFSEALVQQMNALRLTPKTVPEQQQERRSAPQQAAPKPQEAGKRKPAAPRQTSPKSKLPLRREVTLPPLTKESYIDAFCLEGESEYRAPTVRRSASESVVASHILKSFALEGDSDYAAEAQSETVARHRAHQADHAYVTRLFRLDGED